jgi:flagellar biosynthetic protein FlhB
MPAEDRSQRATARRKEQARERGQIVRSRELPAALTLLGVALLMRWGQSGWVLVWRDLLRHLLAFVSHGEIMSLSPLMNMTAWNVVRWAAPPLVFAWCISAFGLMAQGGFVFAPQAFGLKWERFNPANNVGRIFSLAGLAPLLKSLIPLGIVLYLFAAILMREWLHLLHSSHMALPAALAWLFGILYEFSWKAGLVLLFWSGLDYGIQYWNYERSLRMTTQEVRDEAKDTQGNPATRMRIKRRLRDMRRRLMLRQVARATVVITNPEEYAVALEYVPEKMAAPLVLAKGRGLLAQKIKREARWYEVPIVENPPLAQALYRTVEVGATIPAKLYTAVAEVLAFIYRAQARMRAEKEARDAKAAGPQPPRR